ncbi:MAG TPA: HEAT repeat domain-containing protein [Kofleriaceae bacterium]|nr:HEAT repeat domain-containing protein [Kofleriaceae bacterium]
MIALGLALRFALAPAPVLAEDRVASLTRMLSSTSDKTRLAAVLALAKLGDRTVQKPLVSALHDSNVRVRAVAATALGRLGCEAALPTLRELSTGDADDGVRQAASNAAMKIAQAPHPPTDKDDKADPVGLADKPGKPGGPDAAARRSLASSRPGGHADEPHADLFLLVSSSADDSPGTADKTTRKTHAEIVRRVLIEQLKTEASVTSTASEASHWGLAARHIDLSVTKLEVGKAGVYTEVKAELRIAISDDKGKMLSFLSGGAKVQVPTDKFNVQYLPSLRKEALEDAMHGMFRKLLAHLHDQVPG